MTPPARSFRVHCKLKKTEDISLFSTMDPTMGKNFTTEHNRANFVCLATPDSLDIRHLSYSKRSAPRRRRTYSNVLNCRSSRLVNDRKPAPGSRRTYSNALRCRLSRLFNDKKPAPRSRRTYSNTLRCGLSRLFENAKQPLQVVWSPFSFKLVSDTNQLVVFFNKFRL